MSTIKAGTTTGTALVTEGDTTGQLVFQTNGTTTALTIGTNQTATFSGNVAVNGTLTASGGLPSLATPLAVVGNATAGSEIRLPEDTDNGANYVAIKAPNALAANLTLTLPTADGTNGQYLQTNGSGQLAFATVPTTAPGGTTGQVQINNAGAFGAVASGTNGQYLTSGGAGNPPTWTTPSAGALVLISSQTVSSATTYVTFSNVFTSTYDNYVIVYNNVAFNNSYGFSGGILQAQYQKSGSYVTSGYLGAGSNNATIHNFSTGFRDGNQSASCVRHGSYILSFLSGNVWALSAVLGRSDAATVNSLGGSVSLPGTLDRIRLTTVNGTDAFDAGSINIMYEG